VAQYYLHFALKQEAERIPGRPQCGRRNRTRPPKCLLLDGSNVRPRVQCLQKRSSKSPDSRSSTFPRVRV
ncbi:hypothetical protein JTE90_004749, partial [Oedothorax gibbosus]